MEVWGENDGRPDIRGTADQKGRGESGKAKKVIRNWPKESRALTGKRLEKKTNETIAPAS